jgi:MFS family permease
LRFRGQVALAISGSYWIGAMMGSALSIVLLNESLFSPFIGWRIAFLLGAVLGLAVLLIRRYVPESPRWLAIHNQNEEAERTVDDIEDEVRRFTGRELPQWRDGQ